MKYHASWLIDNIEKGQKFKYLFFWGHQPDKSGQITSSCFSQWYAAPFLEDGITYKTAEHWMMAQKALLFNDQKAFEKILNAKSPGEAKAIGREVRNFDITTWEEQRFAIVVKGSVAKFRHHPNLKEFLVNTKERILVEASPVDRIWGIGLAADDERAETPEKWDGLNLLGFALMETRDILKDLYQQWR